MSRIGGAHDEGLEHAAVTLTHRDPAVLDTLLARTDWHARLLNGSDYPLPGIPPLVSLNAFVTRGLLEPPALTVLRAIRDHSGFSSISC